MSSKDTWLAIVALREPGLPAFEVVVDGLRKIDPQAEVPVLSSETSGMVTMSWGEATVAYTLVPRPVPWSQLEGPCATAWYWPEAAENLRHHAAHLLVTLVDEGRDDVEKAMRLTQLAAAVAWPCPVAGILWPVGGLAHDPQAFANLACGMTRDVLPLHLWIDFRIVPTDDGALRLFTTGLDAFDRKEIEVARYVGDAQSLLDHAFNFAHYQIDHQSVIQDGDTIGMPGDVQAVAKHAKSLVDAERDVLLVEFEGA